MVHTRSRKSGMKNTDPTGLHERCGHESAFSYDGKHPAATTEDVERDHQAATPKRYRVSLNDLTQEEF